MVVSINTNTSALVALLQLNTTNRELDTIQERVSTGYKVHTARDDASTFAVAQKQRADRDAYDSVNQSVQRGANILDVSLTALKSISNLLIDMKAKATQAANPALTPADRALINTNYQGSVLQVTSIINAASFDGVNLLNKDPVVPATDDLILIAEPTAAAALSITVPAINLKAVTTNLFGNVITTPAAQTEMATLDTMIQSVNSAMAVMGGNAARLETHASFVARLQDSLTLGIGSLVDADLTRESARLKAVQIQQQLNTQALQIANSRPEQILSLFQRN